MMVKSKSAEYKEVQVKVKLLIQNYKRNYQIILPGEMMILMGEGAGGQGAGGSFT